MLAPTVANCALFGSYLQFVRPGNEKAPRASQVFDAYVGKGGWDWFKPVAPSLAGNLKELEDQVVEPDKTKYHNLANELPWVEFPILTCSYLLYWRFLSTGLWWARHPWQVQAAWSSPSSTGWVASFLTRSVGCAKGGPRQSRPSQRRTLRTMNILKNVLWSRDE
jgi:hypothetical protein